MRSKLLDGARSFSFFMGARGGHMNPGARASGEVEVALHSTRHRGATCRLRERGPPGQRVQHDGERRLQTAVSRPFAPTGANPPALVPPSPCPDRPFSHTHTHAIDDGWQLRFPTG